MQNNVTREITLDQIQYAGNLRTIVHPQLSGSRPEIFCVLELHQLYMSLLGAVAYLAHTRVDIVVFFCALQRHAQAADPARAPLEQAPHMDSTQPEEVGLQEVQPGTRGRPSG